MVHRGPGRRQETGWLSLDTIEALSRLQIAAAIFWHMKIEMCFRRAQRYHNRREARN